MSKKEDYKDPDYFKKYYQEHKEENRQRHLDGYFKEYRKKNKKDLQKYRDKNKPRFNDYLLRRNYNITLEDYNKLFSNQEGKCAICGIPQSELKNKLGVDHNHTTGKVRGLLCNKCNLSLGNIKDDIKILLNMINYLKKEIEALDLQI